MDAGVRQQGCRVPAQRTRERPKRAAGGSHGRQAFHVHANLAAPGSTIRWVGEINFATEENRILLAGKNQGVLEKEAAADPIFLPPPPSAAKDARKAPVAIQPLDMSASLPDKQALDFHFSASHRRGVSTSPSDEAVPAYKPQQSGCLPHSTPHLGGSKGSS